MLGLVIWVERRFRIRRGYLIAAYASFYTFGRFWTEYLRIDNAHRLLGLRLNDWTSIVVFLVSTVVLLTRGRAGPGDERAGDPLPATDGGPALPDGGADPSPPTRRLSPPQLPAPLSDLHRAGGPVDPAAGAIPADPGTPADRRADDGRAAGPLSRPTPPSRLTRSIRLGPAPM